MHLSTTTKVTNGLEVKMIAELEWADLFERTADKVGREISRVKHTSPFGKPEVLTHPYDVVVWPHLECSVQASCQILKIDKTCLEQVQRLTARTVDGQVRKSRRTKLNDINVRLTAIMGINRPYH